MIKVQLNRHRFVRLPATTTLSRNMLSGIMASSPPTRHSHATNSAPTAPAPQNKPITVAEPQGYAPPPP